MRQPTELARSDVAQAIYCRLEWSSHHVLDIEDIEISSMDSYEGSWFGLSNGTKLSLQIWLLLWGLETMKNANKMGFLTSYDRIAQWNVAIDNFHWQSC